MNTERDRLKAWMAEKDFDTRALAKVVGISYNALYKMLSDRSHITSSFKWQFARAFGFEVADTIFDASSKRHEPHHLSEPNIYPAQYAAHQAVATAILRGELARANTYKCAACNEQAEQWHHPSYLPGDHLNVIPLCRICHGKAHSGKLNATFGVVPTHVGLIRIAIAGLVEA